MTHYKPRPKPPSKLDPFKDLLQQRMAQGVYDCSVLLDELRAAGYAGGSTVLKDYVKPHRRAKLPLAVVRYDPAPGEMAQVDWGVSRWVDATGAVHRVYAFAIVFAYSHVHYVEFVERMKALPASVTEEHPDWQEPSTPAQGGQGQPGKPEDARDGWLAVGEKEGFFLAIPRLERRYHSLYDKVYAMDNLREAWGRVRENKGTGSVDGESLHQFAKDWERSLTELQRLLREKPYVPPPVRRHYIPKPDGRIRPPGHSDRSGPHRAAGREEHPGANL